MKKTLIAAAVMAASGIAFAASNVTLYGVIETGVVVQKAKHHDTNVAMVSGFDSGSRWGIRGVEDLGNGVNFQRFPTLDAKKLVNAPKMSAHHREICHF